MNSKLIHIGPLALLVAGVFWSMHINPTATMGYNFGFGIGMFLVPAIPGLILAFIHRSFSKKKAIENETDVIDSSNVPVMKKKSVWFYFSLYTTVLGTLMFIAVMNSRVD